MGDMADLRIIYSTTSVEKFLIFCFTSWTLWLSLLWQYCSVILFGGTFFLFGSCMYFGYQTKKKNCLICFTCSIFFAYLLVWHCDEFFIGLLFHTWLGWFLLSVLRKTSTSQSRHSSSSLVLALIRGYISKIRKKKLTSSCTLTRLARNCLNQFCMYTIKQ